MSSANANFIRLPGPGFGPSPGFPEPTLPSPGPGVPGPGPGNGGIDFGGFIDRIFNAGQSAAVSWLVDAGVPRNIAQTAAEIAVNEGEEAAGRFLENKGVQLLDNGGGFDPGGPGPGTGPAGRKSQLTVRRLVQGIQNGSLAYTGTSARLQLEYAGAARDNSDASVRAEIFQRFRNLPTARRPDDSGNVHNEITIEKDDFQAVASLSREYGEELTVFVINTQRVEEIGESDPGPEPDPPTDPTPDPTPGGGSPGLLEGNSALLVILAAVLLLR